MDNWFSSDTVVVGVGNTILSDDGVGVHAARLLQHDPRVPVGVTILDGGTLGLELMPYVSDASRVLFLDAVNSGTAPGTPIRMTGSELLGTSSGLSVHQLGVQPANTDWSTSLSSEVEAALTGLVDAAVAQLRLWNESPESSLEVCSSAIAISYEGD